MRDFFGWYRQVIDRTGIHAVEIKKRGYVWKMIFNINL
jgi:hypothetical protein